jgi:serine/threonine protein kinase
MTNVPTTASSETCPDCGRALSQDKGCLHCAMELALAAVAECPEAEAELADAGNLLANQGGFAAFSDPVLPRQVGRFRLLRRLGIGGMGAVYEAEDGKLNRIVALKMIRGFHFSTADEMSRFQREAQAAARLDHPNIVPVYEIGEVDGCPFLSMKMIRGGTLADRLKAGRLTAEAAATIMAKVAAAVGYAHEKGILHRDLKPSNILLDEEGTPWLTDFGMAQLSDSAGALTVTGAQLGTPHYMSPEQASGLVRGLTAASDVWGLGAMFYQMLSGNLPYDGESNVAIMHEVVSASPPKLLPRTSREMDLSVLIERCLQKEPAERMQSATLLAEELERWLLRKLIQSRPVSLIEKSARWSLQNRWSLAWGAVAVAGLAFGIGKFWAFTHSRAEQAARPVPDNIITREGSRLTLRKVTGGNQLLWMSPREAGTIGFREPGGLFQMPDGSLIRSTTDGISLKGVSHIVIEGGVGNDDICITQFDAPLPNLQISGGPGNDLIHFQKPIRFLPDAGLEVDLQDDAPTPGLDGINFNADTIVQTTGTGTILARCSGRIWIGKAELRTVDGGITLESNQQAIPTEGPFKGIEMNMAGIISEGKGPINISGRGGTKGIFQFGICLTSGVYIQGGTGAAVTLRGQGGASIGNSDNSGINIGEERCLITSKGADILLEGRGNGPPETGSNNGIVLVGGTIQGNGKVTLDGKGGQTMGKSNHGVLLRGPTVAIRSGGGDIRIVGQGGGSSDSEAADNCGVLIQYGARVKANEADNLTVAGRGGLGGGSDQVGVMVEGGKIDATAGSIKITGTPGNDSSPSVKVLSLGRLRTEGKAPPRVIIEGERQQIEEGAVQVK